MRVAPAFLLLALLPCRVDARPVPLPEVEVQEVLARGLDGMDPGPAGRAVLFAGLASELGSDGVLQTVEHRVERALTLRGGRELGILGITGGGCAGEASLLAVRVHRADGRMVEVPVESAREAAFMPPGACRPSRSKLLQLPRLLPGDSVERMVLRRDHDLAALDGPDGREPLLPRMDAQLQGTVSFAEGVPVVEKVFSLVLPPGTELQLETSGRLASVRRTVLEDGRTRLRLEAEHIPGWPSDGLRSGRGEAPPVAVLSTLRDWRALSSWLRWVTEPLLVPDEGLRAAAGVMVKGARTPDEAALRLLEHVAGILGPGSSGGPHGEACPPGPGLRTSRLRSGTAADLAVLLVTLLRAAGVQDAWLALELGEAGWSEVPGVGPGRWVAAWERSPGDLVVLDPSRPSRAGGGVPAAPAVARILAAASPGDVPRTVTVLHGAGIPAAPDGAAAPILEKDLNVRLLPDGRQVLRTRISWELPRGAGARPPEVPRILYDRARQELRALACRVRSPGGEVLEAREEDWMELPPGGGGPAPDFAGVVEVVLMPPGAGPGDTLELEYELLDREPFREALDLALLLGEPVPAAAIRVTVEAPPGASLRAAVVPSLPGLPDPAVLPAAAATLLRWECRDLPGVPADGTGPRLVVSSFPERDAAEARLEDLLEESPGEPCPLLDTWRGLAGPSPDGLLASLREGLRVILALPEDVLLSPRSSCRVLETGYGSPLEAARLGALLLAGAGREARVVASRERGPREVPGLAGLGPFRVEVRDASSTVLIDPLTWQPVAGPEEAP